MTAIAIWCNKEIEGNPGLWIVADSRITSVESFVLLEDASKIFPLPVICRGPDSNGFFSQITHTQTYGYCFAGSTLMGQNSYLAIAPLLSSLISTATHFPAMTDIADFVLKHLEQTHSEYRVRAGPNSMFEAVLFGWCPMKHQLSTFHFFPKFNGEVYSMTCDPHENMQKHDFLYLGDEKDSLRKRITEAFNCQEIPGRPVSRIPRYVIQDCVDDEDFPTIGGDIQLGIASKFGFEPLLLCKPKVQGQPDAFMSYLGRELTAELTTVGQARVGTPGIA